MKEKSNSKIVFITAIVCILLCIPLGIFIGTTFIYNGETNNVNNTDNKTDSIIDEDHNYKYTETEVFNSIKINNIKLENPRVSGFGGETKNTIAIDAKVDIDSNNPDIIGIKINGYCLDSNDNKYLADGPLGVMAFYSKDNDSYAELGSVTLLPEVGSSIDINWESVEIKYCKIDSALYLGKNGEYIGPSDSQYYKKVLNYEFNF